jgi:hypothetical protein
MSRVSKRDLVARDNMIVLLGNRIDYLSKALHFYADRSNWLEESDGAYVSAIEWNASGDLWRAPWKIAETALATSATAEDE